MDGGIEGGISGVGMKEEYDGVADMDDISLYDESDG